MRYLVICALSATAIICLVRCGDEDAIPQVTVAECEKWFDTLAACEPGGGPLYWEAQASKEFCGVTAALTNCQLKELSKSCQDSYSSYTQCSKTLARCEDLKAYYYGMGSGEVTEYPCSEEVGAFGKDCAKDMYGEAVLKACADEYKAFQDAVNAMNPETDPDSALEEEDTGGDSEATTDMGTDI